MSLSPRAGTLRLAAVALGLVLGLSAAALLPLLLPWAGEVSLALAVVLLSLLPFSGLWLSRMLGRVPEEATRAALAAPVPLAVALVSGLAIVPLFGLYRGQVRVLNHGDEPFVLWVDGRAVARVDPSSGESALAGVELSMPAGRRELRAVALSGGRELFRARELIEGGRPHLFAPLSAGYCFSVEQRDYGASNDARPGALEARPLEGDNPFWVLPDGISWFTPNPEPGPFATSGGTLSCLRQKRCAN